MLQLRVIGVKKLNIVAQILVRYPGTAIKFSGQNVVEDRVIAEWFR